MLSYHHPYDQPGFYVEPPFSPEPQAQSTNNNIQKRGQSKLTLQLTSFVVREMRVELTRRN